MNESRFLSLPALLILLGALLLGGCGDQRQAPPLASARMGGPFTLTSHEGERVASEDFAGRYRIVYFGFTYCPDICPTDLQTLARGLARFESSDPERAARVQPIFITVDPERDTPEVMRNYVSAFHPRLIGLTGTEQEIAEVARSHGVYHARAEGASSTEYLVNHARFAVLYGPEGEPIVFLPHDQGPERVADTLGQWVR